LLIEHLSVTIKEKLIATDNFFKFVNSQELLNDVMPVETPCALLVYVKAEPVFDGVGPEEVG